MGHKLQKAEIPEGSTRTKLKIEHFLVIPKIHKLLYL